MSYQAAEDHATTVRESLPRNILIDIAARSGYLLTRLAVPPFILAHIALATYGLWTTAFVIVSYIGISTMGLSSVYVKCIAEFAAKREFDRANRLLNTGLLVTVPVCILTFVAIAFLWSKIVVSLHIAPALRGEAHEVVLSVVAIFLASLSLSGYRDALVAMQRIAQVQMVWVFTFLTETGLIFLLVASGRGIRGLAEAFLVRTALEIALSSYLAYRSLPWLRFSPALRDRASLKLLFTFGGTVQVQSLLAVGLNSVERAVAAPLVGLEATALLDLAKKLPSMAGSVPLAFTSSLVPAASFLNGGIQGSAERRETVQKLYYKAARYMSMSAGLALALPACLSHYILHVWIGKEYAGAGLLMTAFCISSQVNLLTGSGTSILRGIGLVKEEFYYSIPNIVFLVITLPLSRVLLHQWTAVGVGLSVAASVCLAAGIFLARAHHLLGIKLVSYVKGVLLPGLVPFLLAMQLIPLGPFIFGHMDRWQQGGTLALIGVLYGVLSVLALVILVLEPGERLWFKTMLSVKWIMLGKEREFAHLPGA